MSLFRQAWLSSGVRLGGPLVIFCAAPPLLAAEIGERRCASEAPPPPAVVVASDQGSPPLQLGPGFLWAPDQIGAIGCVPEGPGRQALVKFVQGELEQADLDPKLAVVFASSGTGCQSIYYIPVANDVRGIGYGHLEENEIFDRSPSSQLEGVIFLNDFPYWQEHGAELRTAFLHEVGHRFSGRVWANTERGPVDLTGREHAHWSYFLDSDGSPLEGNDFSAEAPYQTTTEAHSLLYSALDLYLMGALPPREVPDFTFFEDANVAGLDCDGAAVHAASPPQTCGERTLSGTPLSIGIANVIDAEGERSSALTPGTSTSLAFLVVDRKGFDPKMCKDLGDAIFQGLEDYEAATRHKLQLHNLTAGGDCAVLDFEGQSPGPGCTWAPTRNQTPGALVGLGFLGVLAAYLRPRPSGPIAHRSKTPSAL
jgi:hypothetical protein